MSARLVLVVAVAQNGVIGVAGDLAWRISDDLKWFKKTTMGKPILMGRKTFDSIGKPLPGRDNIVVTRSRDFSPPGVFITRSVEAGLKLGTACARAGETQELCIIGGAEIYAQTLACADRIYLTRVAAQVEGDAFFPELDSDDWREMSVGGASKNERNDHDCEFFILDRKSPTPAKKP